MNINNENLYYQDTVTSTKEQRYNNLYLQESHSLDGQYWYQFYVVKNLRV